MRITNISQISSVTPVVSVKPKAMAVKQTGKGFAKLLAEAIEKSNHELNSENPPERFLFPRG